MKIRQLLLCALFAAMTAASVFLPRVPIPGTPLMFTFQTFVVFLAGLLLEPKYALISQAVYMALGLIGLPVFMSGGGLSYVLQPSFGFIIGFSVCALLTSLLVRKALLQFIGADHRHKVMPAVKMALYALLSMTAMYIIAIVYMYLIYSLYLNQTTSIFLIAGNVAVFLLMDAVKFAAALPLGAAILRRLPNTVLPVAKNTSGKSGANQ